MKKKKGGEGLNHGYTVFFFLNWVCGCVNKMVECGEEKKKEEKQNKKEKEKEKEIIVCKVK